MATTTTTRRQREAAAPRPRQAATANAGTRNQTAAAATSRPHARNRRALGDIGNHVNASVVDGEANRRRHLTRSLSAQPNAAADENTIAPARPAAVEGARASRVGRAVSGENKKLSKGATSRVTGTRAEMDTIVDHLMNTVAAANAVATRAVENMERTGSLVQKYHRLANQLEERYEEIAGDNKRLVAETNKLESEKAQKEAQVQKVMEENVRLRAMLDKKDAMLDKKEAQLLAMSEQCKFMALNHPN